MLDRDVREVLAVVAEGEAVRDPLHDLLGGHHPLDRVDLHLPAVEGERLVPLRAPHVGDLGMELTGDHVGQGADLREDPGPAEVEAAVAGLVGADHVERRVQLREAGHRRHLRLHGRGSHRQVGDGVVGHRDLPEHDVAEVVDEDDVVPGRDGDLPLAVDDAAEGAEESRVIGVEDEDVRAGDRLALPGRHVDRQRVELVRRGDLRRSLGQRDA